MPAAVMQGEAEPLGEFLERLVLASERTAAALEKLAGPAGVMTTREKVKAASEALRVCGPNLRAISKRTGISRTTLLNSKDQLWVKWRRDFDDVRARLSGTDPVKHGFHESGGGLNATEEHDWKSIDDKIDGEAKASKRR